MPFPEVLKNILPMPDELSKGIRSKTLPCPERNEECNDQCIDCLVAVKYHEAFLNMSRFGETRITLMDISKQTSVPGIGSFETRNGKIFYELIKKIDINAIL